MNRASFLCRECDDVCVACFRAFNKCKSRPNWLAETSGLSELSPARNGCFSSSLQYCCEGSLEHFRSPDAAATGYRLPPGKYIKLLYDSDCRLMGASTDHFLLEKSRLVKVDSGERGYHIFYQVHML